MSTRKKMVVVGVMAGLTVVVWAGWRAYRYVSAVPVISIDYVAKCNEMQRPDGYDPEEDGAELYLRACTIAEGWSAPDFGREGDRVPWPGDLNDVERKLVRDYVAQSAEGLKLAEESTERKYCWVRRDSRWSMLAVLMPELGGTKELTYAFLWRGKLKAFDGDVAGGLHDVMLPMRLGRIAQRKNPTLIDWMLGRAIMGTCNPNALDVIAHTDFSSRQLEEFAAEIKSLAAGCDSIMEAENLTFYDTVQRTFTDDGHGDGHAIMGEVRQLLEGPVSESSNLQQNILRWWMELWSYNVESRKATIARWDRVMAEGVKLVAMEPWQVAADANMPWQRLENDASVNTMVGMLMPARKKLAEVNGQHTVSVRGTLGAIAALRFKKDKGSLPESWDEIVAAGYLKQVPIDSFSGKPLVYKRDGETFSLYSVGTNTLDDGGTPKDKNDIVLWPVRRE